MKKHLLILSLYCLGGSISHADVLTLKDGRMIDGEVIEEAKDFLRVDLEGQVAIYYLDQIASRDEDRVEDMQPLEEEVEGDLSEEEFSEEHTEEFIQELDLEFIPDEALETIDTSSTLEQEGFGDYRDFDGYFVPDSDE